MTPATATTAGPLDRELAFTELYLRHRDDHIAIREATCLKAGRCLHPIREGDLFAARHVKAALDPEGQLVGFGLEHDDSGAAYYCEASLLAPRIEAMEADEEYRRRVREMLRFWEKENTLARSIDALPEETRLATSNEIAHQTMRLSGLMLDFDKLVRLGLPGLAAEVREHMAAAPADGRDPRFYEGILIALDAVAEVCLDYAAQARGLAEDTADPGRQADLLRMASDLEHVTRGTPETFAQGIQLCWVYAVMAGTANLGRMDVYLGDLLAGELDSGALTEQEALRLLGGLWQLVAGARWYFNARIIVGGMGRRNEANADRFALLAMEASRLSGTTEPQLSLRCYSGMNPALLDKALTCIGEGCVYPVLYNDDVNVPAVQNGFGVPRDEAAQYLPYGCGEYDLYHRSIGSPNSGFNLLKCVQVAMNDGVDPDTGRPLGLKTGEFAGFDTFEQLWDAYASQVEYHVTHIARRHALEYETERATAAFLLVSALYDDCLERGRSVVDGGARYRGGITETLGLVNAADSLTAIKKLVYDERRFTPEQLLRMLAADWAGFEHEHRMFREAPKYGNDDDEADEMLVRVSRHAGLAAVQQAQRTGLDYFLIVNINNHVHIEIGRTMGATPDGREAGSPIANGNTPTAGNDRSGVTAFLNSIAKPDPALHAGYVHNMKFGKRMFGTHRPQLEALLGTYFARGGTQAMITVVDRGDLEEAMRAPEKHPNLMVRVGGFCARFVELEPDLQRDIIRRTFYE